MRAPKFPQVAFKRGNGRACRALACLPRLIAFALLPAALLFSLSGCAPSHQPEHRVPPQVVGSLHALSPSGAVGGYYTSFPPGSKARF